MYGFVYHLVVKMLVYWLVKVPVEEPGHCLQSSIKAAWITAPSISGSTLTLPKGWATVQAILCDHDSHRTVCCHQNYGGKGRTKEGHTASMNYARKKKTMNVKVTGHSHQLRLHVHKQAIIRVTLSLLNGDGCNRKDGVPMCKMTMKSPGSWRDPTC